jgi:hypothetical protein
VRCPICRYVCTFLLRLISPRFFLYVCLMIYIFRLQLSIVHTPSLPPPFTIFFTALMCEILNNKYFAMSWKWRFLFIFYGLYLGYELEVIKHFTMKLCCIVTVYSIHKIMTDHVSSTLGSLYHSWSGIVCCCLQFSLSVSCQLGQII